MTEEREEIIGIPKPVEQPISFIPEEEPVPVLEEAPPEEEAVEDLSDIGKVTREDIMGKRDGNSEPDDMSDLTGLDEEDMEDLFGVSESDILGDGELIPGTPPSSEPQSRPRPIMRFRRTTKRYLPPPATGIRGIRG